MRWIITCITLALLACANMAHASSWEKVEVGDLTVEMPTKESNSIASWETVVWAKRKGRTMAYDLLIYGISGKEGELEMQAFSGEIQGNYSLEYLLVSLLPSPRGEDITFSMVEPSGVGKMNAEGLVGIAYMNGWTYTATVYVSGGYLYALRTKHPTGKRKYWRWINKFDYSFRAKSNKRLRILH